MTRIDRKWLVVLAVIPATTLYSLDMTVVNVALPYIQGAMAASSTEITWVISGYLLSGIILMPLVGFCSSVFGRKRFFIASVFLFVASSFLCGLSWNLDSIVTFRVLQGFGGGALIPLAQAILSESFPEEEQGTAMAIFSVAVVLGPAVGPLLGGWIVTNYSWKWIFFINVPIGVINLVLLSMFLEDPPFIQKFKGSVDWLGIASLTVGLSAMEYVLTEGEQLDWFGSNVIVYGTIIAAAAIVLFVLRELLSKHPAVPLRMLKDINLSANSVLSMVFEVGMLGSLYLLPMLLQDLLGYSAYDTGLAIMSRGVAMAVVMPLAGRLFNKLGPKLMVSAGFIITMLSTYRLGMINLDISFWNLFWPQFWQGVGFSLIIVPATVSSFLTIETRFKTDASGIYNLLKQVAASVTSAVLATMMDNNVQFDHLVLGKKISAYNTPSLMYLERSAAVMHAPHAYPPTRHALAFIDAMVNKQAYILASNHVFLIMVLIFLVSMPFIALIKGIKDVHNSPNGKSA